MDVARTVSRAVVIGSDSPAMPRERLGDAFEILRTWEAVFGPAEDGGYYLVGLAGSRPGLFHGIPWSTDAVMAATEAAAALEGVTAALLPRHRDVDSPAAMTAHLDLCRRVMFGPSELSRREREAIAVAVSAANACHY